MAAKSLTAHARIPFRRRILPTVLALAPLLAACAAGGTKRAFMASAIPSPSASPFVAPFRPSVTLPPPLTETETPDSVLSCGERKGVVRPDSIESTILGQTMGFFVYLPPCYAAESGARYPVLVLFHGLERTPDQWLGLGLATVADHEIVSGGIRPAIIVLPYITDGALGDAAVLVDLLPAIDSRYRSAPGRANRAVGGVSRGAEWALQLALTRADLFGAVGAHSLAPGATLAMELPGWLDAVPEGMWPRVYLDAGFYDPMLPQIEALLLEFDRRRLPYEKTFQPGGHSDEYWSGHLADYLRWYSAGWPLE